MDALTTTGFLLMGLTGSLHCAGMCGPIIWMMPFQQSSARRRWAGIALYHTGRICAYGLLAMAFHSLRHVFQPQWQQMVSLVSGAVLMLAGVASFIRPGAIAVLRPFNGLVLAALGKVAGKQGAGWLAATGFFNGLLPCGMVYIALAASVKTAGAAPAVQAMLCFGAGTVPMLVAVTLLRRRIRFATGRWINTLMLVFGVLLMLRGANLGIPYLSPECLQVTETRVPVMRCCHPAP